MTRGERRCRTEKVKKKRSNYCTANHPKNLKTPKPCSCFLCGNRRKWEGKTRQEKTAGSEVEDGT